MVGTQLGYVMNEGRDSSREEERLTLARDGIGKHLEDLFEFVAEAHVEHAISFVEDENFEVLASRTEVKSGRVAGKVIEETTRSGDEDVFAVTRETLSLSRDVGTTDNVLHRESALKVGEQHLSLLLDLKSELTRRREDENRNRRLRGWPGQSAKLLNRRMRKASVLPVPVLA